MIPCEQRLDVGAAATVEAIREYKVRGPLSGRFPALASPTERLEMGSMIYKEQSSEGLISA